MKNTVATATERIVTADEMAAAMQPFFQMAVDIEMEYNDRFEGKTMTFERDGVKTKARYTREHGWRPVE